MHASKPQPAETDRQVEYIPPETQVLEQLARQVCATLAEKYHPAYGETDVIDGLTAFLTTVAKLTAKSCTRGKADWLDAKHRNQQEI